MKRVHILLGIATVVLPAEFARAGSMFTWSGSATGTHSSTTFTGVDFEFSVFVADISEDLTPSSDFGSYAIDGVRLSVDGGAFVELLGAFDSGWSSILLDPGATQLAGASNLFGSMGGDATFQIGSILPAGSFEDVKDLATTGSFTVTGLTGTGGNFFSSAGFDLELTTHTFGYGTDVAMIPLPAPVVMGAVGLAGVVLTSRSRGAGPAFGSSAAQG